jgi:hypothetical protein
MLARNSSGVQLINEHRFNVQQQQHWGRGECNIYSSGDMVDAGAARQTA